MVAYWVPVCGHKEVTYNWHALFMQWGSKNAFSVSHYLEKMRVFLDNMVSEADLQW